MNEAQIGVTFRFDTNQVKTGGENINREFSNIRQNAERAGTSMQRAFSVSANPALQNINRINALLRTVDASKAAETFKKVEQASDSLKKAVEQNLKAEVGATEQMAKQVARVRSDLADEVAKIEGLSVKQQKSLLDQLVKQSISGAAQRVRAEEVAGERAIQNAQRQNQSIRRIRQEESQNTSNQSAGSSSNLITSTLGSFAGNVAAQAVTRITSAAAEGGRALLDYSAKLQQTEMAFTTLLGSGDKAKALLKEIQVFAKETPFEFQGISELSQRLLGANVEMKKVIPLMRDIGNIVAATGEASQDRLAGVTVAITQMISKQKVSAEEMEQLAERGVNGFQILSEATGKSQAELRKLAEDGKISADVMISALQQISQQKFGDAMQKQSQTFNGAMSNIKDAVMITASTAFAPLFQKISTLAVEASKEIEAQNGDFEAIGLVITKYIGQGLGLGLNVLAQGIGSYFKNRLTEIVNGEAIIDPITKNIGTGLLKGLGFDIGNDIKSNLNPALKETSKEFENAAKNAKGIPNLSKQLDSQKAAADAKKLSEEVNKIAVDLSTQILFYGDQTAVAATKQQLLTQGVYDFNSAQAQSVIKIAENLDKLKASREEQEKHTEKIKEFREQLLKTRQDAEFEVKFPNATELDRFNRMIRETAGGFVELRSEIEATRRAIEFADWSKGFKNLLDSVKAISDGIDQGVNQKWFSTLDGFSGEVAKIAQQIQAIKDATLSTTTNDQFGVNVFPQDFEKQIRGYIEAIETWKKVTGGSYLPETVTQPLKNYLTSLGSAKIGDERHSIFSDKEADVLIQKLLRLKEIIGQNDKADGLKSYNQLLGELTEKTDQAEKASEHYRIKKELEKDTYKALLPEQRAHLELLAKEADFAGFRKQLNEQLLTEQRGGRELTAFERVQREINENYRHLDPLQKQDLLNLASQIDHQTQLRAAYDETRETLHDLFDIMTEGGQSMSDRLGNAFEYIADRFKKMLVEMAADWVTSQIFGDNQSQQSATGSSSFNLSSLFGLGSASQNVNIGGFGGGLMSFPAITGGNSTNQQNTVKTLLNNITGGNSSVSLIDSIGQTTGTSAGQGIAGKMSSQSNITGSLLSGGSLKNIGGSLALMAPFAGMSLGLGLGAGSRSGSVLGGIGGLLAGFAGLSGLSALGFGGASIFGIGAGTSAPGLGGLLGAGGMLGGVGSFLGGIGGAFGATGAAATALGATVVAAPVAVALLVGSFLLSRNSKRKKEEAVHNQAQLDSLAGLDKIISALQKDQMSGSEAINQGEAIKAEYVAKMSQLTDKKTKNNALKDIDRINGKLDIIKREADSQLRRENIDRKIRPEFATGGVIPGAIGQMTAINAHGGEVIANLDQQAKLGRLLLGMAGVPGLGGGSEVSAISNGSSGSGQPIINIYPVFNARVDAEGITVEGLKSEGGRREQGRNNAKFRDFSR